MSRRFKLLKDTPSCNKGMIFSNDINADLYWNGSRTESFEAKYVESNPEWFEEIKQKERVYIKCTGLPIVQCSEWKQKDNLITKYPIAESFTHKEIETIEAALNGEFIELKTTVNFIRDLIKACNEFARILYMGQESYFACPPDVKDWDIKTLNNYEADIVKRITEIISTVDDITNKYSTILHSKLFTEAQVRDIAIAYHAGEPSCENLDIAIEKSKR